MEIGSLTLFKKTKKSIVVQDGKKVNKNMSAMDAPSGTGKLSQ